MKLEEYFARLPMFGYYNSKRKGEVEKANPYHDEGGRFTSADKAVAPKGKRRKWRGRGAVDKSRQEYERAFAKTRSLPDGIGSGVMHYSIMGFSKINASLRKSSGKKIIRDTERMDLCFAKGGTVTKSDIVVFRGAPMRASTLNAMLGKGTVEFDRYGNLEVSKPSRKGFVDHGFVSTSLDVERGKMFSLSLAFPMAAKGGVRPVAVLFQITVKKGSRIITGTYKGKKEKEVILNRGTKFRVVSVENPNPYGREIVVQLEAVSP
jgi:hypothetical protein